LVRVCLINEWLEVIESNTTKVRDNKKNLFSVFCKFSLTGAKVDLVLKYECLELIKAAPTKEIWFLDLFAPFFGCGLACLANAISSTYRSNPKVSRSRFCPFRGGSFYGFVNQFLQKQLLIMGLGCYEGVFRRGYGSLSEGSKYTPSLHM